MTEPTKTSEVLILFSYKGNKVADYDDLANELAQYSGGAYKFLRGAHKEMQYKIVNNKMSIFDSMNKRDVATYDLVFFRMWEREYERATATAAYLKSKKIPFFEDEVYNYRAFTKLTEVTNMVLAGLPVPDTYFSINEHTLVTMKNSKEFGYPLIVKPARGLKGRNNFLVKDHKELSQVLIDYPEVEFMVQNFIPNDCDYRLLVMGDKVELAIRRTRSSGHVNNTSQGAEGEVVPLSEFDPIILEQAVTATKIHKRDLAGVDVIINKQTGAHAFLEVNKVPQLATGVCVEDKIKALDRYIKKMIGFKND